MNKFDELTENERKTIASLIKIEKGVIKRVGKTLSEICRKTKINNKHPGKETHPGYQQRILKDLIKNENKNKEILEKVKNKYYIKRDCIDLAYSTTIQKKIKDLEKKDFFIFSDSIIYGIKNNWLDYPEIHQVRKSYLCSWRKCRIIQDAGCRSEQDVYHYLHNKRGVCGIVCTVLYRFSSCRSTRVG